MDGSIVLDRPLFEALNPVRFTDASQPFVSGISFHNLNMILSSACTALVILIILGLPVTHTAHYSQPNE